MTKTSACLAYACSESIARPWIARHSCGMEQQSVRGVGSAASQVCAAQSWGGRWQLARSAPHHTRVG